ncbi:MAG TPA: HAD-IIIA family hydrolase [Kiloniellales bacterium]|nr:HAD-IIIA family hydrolase [Kiloniellales bacterium]
MTDWPLREGIWLAAAGGAKPAAGEPGLPALFLDRDGLLVREVGYLHRPADVRLYPGAAALLLAAARAGWRSVVVTNQSGIGRGLYGWEAFAATQARIEALLAAEGAALDLVVACPFHAEALPPWRVADHPCRKPRPGMLLLAAKTLGLDLERSWILGDQASDMAAGRAAGLAGGGHLATGHGQMERARALREARDGFVVRPFATLLEVPAAFGWA